MIRHGNHLATVRAAGKGAVEVASLDRENFIEFINQSTATREEILQISEERYQAIRNLHKENKNVDPTLA